jgi:hypothetical protein
MSESKSVQAAGWHLPPWVHVPRLELILGHRLADLSWEAIEDVVRRKIPEDLTLDFKGELYADGKELAKDLAAMANSAGGLIILGITDDEHGRADALSKVDLSDDQTNRMTQILSTRVAPLLPDVQVHELHDPNDPGRGVYLLLAPASDLAPLGVRSGKEGYMWPVREDRTTRYMYEPELASRYRDRFAGAARQLERLEQANRDGVSRLWLQKGWLAITLTPARPGRLSVDRETVRSWLREHLTSRGWRLSLDGMAPDVTAVLGRRRVIFTDKIDHYFGYSTDHHMELHSDGTGFAARAITTTTAPPNAADRGMNEAGQYFHTLTIESSIVEILDILAHHAVHTGGGGDFSVRAELLPGIINIAAAGRPPGPHLNRTVALIEDFRNRGGSVVQRGTGGETTGLGQSSGNQSW